MGIPNPILYFTSNDSLDHNSQISCLWTDFKKKFFDLEIRWGFQIRYWQTWLSEPHKFVIMTRCRIIFDITFKWYSVIFAANLYLSIFVCSSDILNLVFIIGYREKNVNNTWPQFIIIRRTKCSFYILFTNPKYKWI